MPRLNNIIAAGLFLFFTAAGSYAAEDGFLGAGKIEGRHFTIYYASRADIAGLAKELSISISDKMLAGAGSDRNSSSEEDLAEALDILYIRVCDILDMNLYSFKTNIKISRSPQELNGIYAVFFKKAPKETRSFYSYALNTIYTCPENFNREIIGHEIAHAVISNYFVVLPSEKVQEVLAGYVTYQLRNPTP